MKAIPLPLEETRRQVEALWHEGKCREALELAKTQATLVPEAEVFLRPLQIELLAATGDFGALLEYLHSPSQVEGVEIALKKYLTDPALLAHTPALPPDHPLRQSACEVQAAFLAVTSGPVTDEQIQLPSIPLRHPLAGWKWLIRAIAALYRSDQANALRALEALDDTWAVARFKPLLLSLLEEKHPPLSGVAKRLERQITSPQLLPGLLEALDEALDEEAWLESEFEDSFLDATDEVGPDVPHITGLAKKIIGILSPETSEDHRHLLTRMHAVLAMMAIATSKPDKALRGKGMDAAFWRALYHQSLQQKTLLSPMSKVVILERFNAHALAEGLFQSGSAEQSNIFREILRFLRELGPIEFKTFGAPVIAQIKSELRDVFKLYDLAEPHTRRLKPSSLERYFSQIYSLEHWFNLLQSSAPNAQEFQNQLEWMKSSNPARDEEPQEKALLIQWTQALPNDPIPWQHLGEINHLNEDLDSARDSFLKALALAPENARLRSQLVGVLLELVFRELRNNPEKLPAPHLRLLGEILTSSGASLDDHAWLEMLRRLEEQVLGRQVLPAPENAPDSEKLWGMRVSREIRELLEDSLGLYQPDPNAPQENFLDGRLPRDILKFQQLKERFDLPYSIPAVWWQNLESILSDCHLSTKEWLEIGDLALRSYEQKVAYKVSVKALADAAGALLARALWLRHESLPSEVDAYRRGQCLQAAKQLAWQVNDLELLEKFPQKAPESVIQRLMRMTRGGSEENARDERRELSEAQCQAIVLQEKAAVEFPVAPPRSRGGKSKTRKPPSRKGKGKGTGPDAAP